MIAKIEQYKEICQKANKITYADKIYLIKEAEKLFFDEEIINKGLELYPEGSSIGCASQAEINRVLLDR